MSDAVLRSLMQTYNVSTSKPDSYKNLIDQLRKLTSEVLPEKADRADKVEKADKEKVVLKKEEK